MPVVEMDHVVKFFYTILYTITAALALVWWSHEGRRDSLVSSTAWRANRALAAEVPSSAMPGAMSPSTGFVQPPPLPGMAPSSNTIGNGLAVPLPAPSTPDSWPNGRAAGPAAPPVNTTPVVPYPVAPTNQVILPSYVVPGQSNPASYQAILPPAGAPSMPLASPEKTLDGTQVLARVGPQEMILVADLLPEFNQWLAINSARVPPSKIPEVREMFLRQRVEQAIQTKAILSELRRKIPPEGFKHFTAELEKQFDEVETPKVLEKNKMTTTAELNAQLQKMGGSLERERRAFVEKVMAITWVQQQVKTDEEVTHEAMLYYYHLHPTEFDLESKARWEELAVRLDKYPTREAAYNALSEAGNQVLRGTKFADVARRMSSGTTAKDGGVFDWTKEGSLVSTVLDQALFSLPVGQLSPIIEDASGFHIVRVVERQQKGRQSFVDAQPKIKEKIQEERRTEGVNKYVQKLIAHTSIWTIYDGQQSPSAEGNKLPYAAAASANLGAGALPPVGTP